MDIAKILDLMDELERTHKNALSRWSSLRALLEQRQADEQYVRRTVAIVTTCQCQGYVELNTAGVCVLCNRPSAR